MAIHPNTDIAKSARIADDASIGFGAVVGENSVIESGVELGPHVVIGPNTTIREGVRIYPGAVIGTEPQDYKYDGTPTICEVGKGSIIREYCTINRGTKASGATIIGENCFLMSYAHVGHDGRIGNNVIMATGAAVGGHCLIEDYANLGGKVGMHQFLRVGTMAMIGGMSGLRKDAPPYMITAGPPPAKVHGLNVIGMKRNGISGRSRAIIRTAYRILYRSGLNIHDGLSKIEAEIEKIPEIEHLIQFFKTTKRGVSAAHRVNVEYPDEDYALDESDAIEV